MKVKVLYLLVAVSSLMGPLVWAETVTDIEPPISTHTIDPAPNAAGWNRSSPVSVNITATDNGTVAAIHYILDGGFEVTVDGSSASVSIVGEGTHTVEYWAVDEAGNEETPHNIATVKLDTTPPGIPEGLSPVDGTVTNDTTPTLSWDAPSDFGGSGIKNYRYQVDDDPDFSSPLRDGYTRNTHYSPRLTDGVYYWRIYARDNAGNKGDWTEGRQIIIDTEPPQITCPGDVTQDNDSGQCSAVVTWAVPIVSDNVGVASVSCDPPSGSTFPVGTTTVTCTATDLAGNVTTCSFGVTVNDVEPPITSFLATPPNPDNDPTPYFAWEATDSNGCTAPNDLLYSTRLDGGSWSEWSPDTSATIGPLSEGLHTFEVRAQDEAGNVEATASYAWVIDLTAPVPTIVVSPTTINQQVRLLTVTVTYDEPMDPSTAPVITLTGTHWGPQTPVGGGWSAGNTVYTAAFLHDGTQESIPAAVASIAPASGATDLAGNPETGAVSAPFVVDLVPPTVRVIVPEEEGQYVLNDDISALWEATDEFPGLDSASAADEVNTDMASGEPFYTGSVGFHEFTVTAVDLAGNVTTVTVLYQVVYNVHPGGVAGGAAGVEEEPVGFLDKSIAGGGGEVGIAQLEAIYTVGEVIHIRCSLTDAEGELVTDAVITCTLVRVHILPEREHYIILHLWPLDFDEETSLYYLDIGTEGLVPGIYDLWLGFDDGTHRRLRIRLEERAS